MNIFKKLKQWREERKELKLFMNAVQESSELGGDEYEMSVPIKYIGVKILNMFINGKTFTNNKNEKYVITEYEYNEDGVLDLTIKKLNK